MLSESQCYLDELFRDAVQHPPLNVTVILPSWCTDPSELHHFMLPNLAQIYEQHIKYSPHKPLVIDLNLPFTFTSTGMTEVKRPTKNKHQGSAQEDLEGVKSEIPGQQKHAKGKDERRRHRSGPTVPDAHSAATVRPQGASMGDDEKDPWTGSDVISVYSEFPTSSVGRGTTSPTSAHGGNKMKHRDSVKPDLHKPKDDSGTPTGIFSRVRRFLETVVMDPVGMASPLMRASSCPVDQNPAFDNVSAVSSSSSRSKSPKKKKNKTHGAHDRTPPHPMIPLTGVTQGSLVDLLNAELCVPCATQQQQGDAEGAGTTKVDRSHRSRRPIYFSRRHLSLAKMPVPLPLVEMVPIFDDQELTALRDDYTVSVYEHLLLAAQLHLGNEQKKYETEMIHVFQPSLRISPKQHLDSFKDITAALTTGWNTQSTPGAAEAQVSRCVTNSSSGVVQLDALFVQKCLQYATPGTEFHTRWSRLLELIKTGEMEDGALQGLGGGGSAAAPLDVSGSAEAQQQPTSTEPAAPTSPKWPSILLNETNGGVSSPRGMMSGKQRKSVTIRTPTSYSLAVRGSLYAGCLLPLYHLEPDSTAFAYTEANIQHCLKRIKDLLRIPEEIVPYCHLHAQLIATNMAESREHQCVYLRTMARTVNHLGTLPVPYFPARSKLGAAGYNNNNNSSSSSTPSSSTAAPKTLTPMAKYCYYVLQESFAIAMIPMSWLDSMTASKNICIATLALFMEACVALPSPLLSACAKVDGCRLFPPYYSGSDFLVALLGIFLSMGTLRRFETIIPGILLGRSCPSSDQGLKTSGSSPLVPGGPQQQQPRRSTPATLQQMLFRARGLLNDARQHSTILSRTISGAGALLLPSMMQMGAATLFLHWGILEPITASSHPNGGTRGSSPPPHSCGFRVAIPELEVCRGMPLPADLVSAVELFLHHLVSLVPTSDLAQHQQPINVTHMLRAATTSYLSLLSCLISRWEVAWLQRATQSTETKMKTWTADLWSQPEPGRHGMHGLQEEEDHDGSGGEENNPNASKSSIGSSDVSVARASHSIARPPEELMEVVRVWLPPVSTFPAPLGDRAMARLMRRIDCTVAILSRVMEFVHVPCSAPMASDLTFPRSLSIKAARSLTPCGHAPPGFVMSERMVLFLQREHANATRLGAHHIPFYWDNWRKTRGRTASSPQELRKQHTAFLRELLSRLVFLLFLSGELERYIKDATSMLRDVERVTGNVTAAASMEKHFAPLRDRVHVVILRQMHLVMAHVLAHEGAPASHSPATFYDAMECYMQSEAKLVNVRPHGSLHSISSCPRKYPHVTMRYLIALAEERMDTLLAPLLIRNYGAFTTPTTLHWGECLWRELQTLLGIYLIAILYNKCLIASGVYYTPGDVPRIRHDCYLVRRWLLGVAHVSDTLAGMEESPPSRASPPTTQDVRSACPAVRMEAGGSSRCTHLIEEADRILREIHYMLHYVLSAPSSILVEGGQGVPPLENLPADSADTPWSKFMILRILSHRADSIAKDATEAQRRKCVACC